MSAFNFTTAQVVCITAMINHKFPQFKYMIFHLFICTYTLFCLVCNSQIIRSRAAGFSKKKSLSYYLPGSQNFFLFFHLNFPSKLPRMLDLSVELPRVSELIWPLHHELFTPRYVMTTKLRHRFCDIVDTQTN